MLSDFSDRLRAALAPDGLPRSSDSAAIKSQALSAQKLWAVEDPHAKNTAPEGSWPDSRHGLSWST